MCVSILEETWYLGESVIVNKTSIALCVSCVSVIKFGKWCEEVLDLQ